jgi:peptidyl-prolyl cis-trans isomerase D
MFDLVTKHKRIVQVILALLVVPFAIWGVESYRFAGGGRDAVAIVDGANISQREFGEELRRQQDQLRQMFRGQIDPAALDTPEARHALLQSLISQRVVAREAIRSDVGVPDELLYDSIASIPAFQVDGKFSKNAYETLLRQQNPPMTPRQFEARMRYDLALQQLSRAVADSAIAPRSVAARLTALETQQREVSEARIAAQQFLPQVKIDEAKARAYYDANQAEFRIPERVRAEYLVLSQQALQAQESVSPEDVRKQWEATYGAQARDREEARKKAQALLAAVRKDPASFAETAKKESQDTGSRESGGDLGWVQRGAFVKPFEDAMFRMKEGAISDIVESDFGLHIIRLTGIRKVDGREERRASHILIPAPPAAKPFEAQRAEIEAELKKQRAARRFAEAADSFNNTVYEQADSLKPAAERFKLQLQTTGWITKSTNQELGALDNPKLLAALFSSDSLQNKRNTDAIEVAPNTLVAARVIEHRPAAQRSFDEVKAELIENLRRREAAELAQKDGAEKLEQLRKGGDAGVKWGAAKLVSRRDAQGLPGEVLRQVVSADVAKLPAYVGVPVPGSGYLLLRISKVVEADASKQGADTAARVASQFGAAQYQAYVESLRSRADIEVNPANLEKK